MTDGLKPLSAGAEATLGSPERLAALARTGLFANHEVPPADGIFDRLTSLASRLVGAPIALVSLVSDAEQLFIGATGVPGDLRRTPLAYSFCRFVVAAGERLVVADVRQHEGTRTNPAIEEFGVIAYCGIPLRVGTLTVGAFCALDEEVRSWTDVEVSILEDLAALAQRELEAQARLHSEALVPARFAPLLNALPVAVYAADGQGRLLFYNDRAAQLWGAEPPGGILESEAFALRRARWHDGTPVQPEETPLLVALRTAAPVAPVEFVIGAEDSESVLLASAELLLGSDGTVAGALGVLQDVTALRKASMLRDELLALVSHELRTPLTVISGMGSFLARGGAALDPGASQEAASEIVAASRRMERAVENMLQLSHIEHDGSRPEPVLAQAILNAALLEHAADFPAVSITQVGTERHATVLAVERWSVLAFGNLLHNASQYGDPSEAPLVELVRHEDEVQFRVCNAGPVFTENQYNAMFEPFFRGPNIAQRFPGAGLGLTTSRKLAEAQGGRLLAGPRPDHRGSMFTLALPAFEDTGGDAD